MDIKNKIAEEKKYIINSVNENKIKNEKYVVTKKNFGKGRIASGIDKICITGAAILETLKATGIWNYVETDFVANLTTKFNTWIASISTVTPDLTGMSAEEIFALGQSTALNATNASANSWGLVFSTVLTFILEHPTVTVLGVTALTSVSAYAFKKLKNKIREIRIPSESKDKAR